MTPSEMQIQIVRDQTQERLRVAGRRRHLRPATAHVRDAAVCIRLARAADASALKRLAELEGASVPAGDSLVAAIDGHVLAAIGVTAGETLADPFRPTAELVEQLAEARGHMLGLSPGRVGRLARLRRWATGQSTPRAAGTAAVPGSESLLTR